jgi:hypothetical protein
MEYFSIELYWFNVSDSKTHEYTREYEDNSKFSVYGLFSSRENAEKYILKNIYISECNEFTFNIITVENPKNIDKLDKPINWNLENDKIIKSYKKYTEYLKML